MIHITLEPEASIEPGHQWLVVSDTPEGRALATIIMGGLPLIKRGSELLIPHDRQADENIFKLINQLAHARFSAPALVQLTMEEAPELP